MTYEGRGLMMPLVVTWSGGDSCWVELLVTHYEHDEVGVTAINVETGMAAWTSLSMRSGTFSTQLVNMVHAAIEDVADEDGRHWKSETWEVSYRD